MGFVQPKMDVLLFRKAIKKKKKKDEFILIKLQTITDTDFTVTKGKRYN